MPNFSTYKPSIGPGQRDYVTKDAAALDELDARFNVAALFGGSLAVTGAFTANGAVTLGDAAGDALTINPSAVTWSNNPTHSGNHTFSGNLIVTGNLTINGTTQTINSTVVTIDDPVFTLGGDTAPSADDNKDRGIEFRWHTGSAAKVGFFGYDDSAQAFTFIPDATNSSEVFSGTAGAVVFGAITGTNGTFTGNVSIGDASGDTLTIAPNAVTWSNNPTHSGNHTFSGNLIVQGDTTIGNASGDALTIAPSAVTWSNNPTHSGNHRFSGTVTMDGTAYIGTTANANVTLGLTINQGGADDHILSFQSSDVAHGMTTVADTKAYGFVQKIDANTGGLKIAGLGSGAFGVQLASRMATDNTAKDATALGYIILDGLKKNGTGTQSPGANANLVVIRDGNAGSTKVIFDFEGDLHIDGTSNTFDAWDDAALVRAFDIERSPAGVIRSEWDAHVKYHRKDLIKAGIVSREGFVNVTQLQRLHNGAIWQLYTQNSAVARDLKALEQKLRELQ